MHAKSYGLLNARVALSDIPLAGRARGQVALFGENLTDEHYNVQGVDFSYMATVVFGDRRTFGLEARVDF